MSVPSSGTGSLTGVLDTDTNVFTWTVLASGLTSNLVAAHFHGNTPPPVAPESPDVARPVALGFLGAEVPAGVSSYVDTLTSNTGGMFVGSADLDDVLADRAGDFPATVAEQINGLLGTQWYVNLHTASNPSGEIRGQVFLAGPVAAVPIPAVGWLVGLGVGALAMRGSRRGRSLPA